jgi:NAD(P)-dependent dehydrogenase (short-subunit alcohol dehydrogenase family)
MRQATPRDTIPTILLVGASRGLGHAMAAEFLRRGWNVVGTVRGDARTLLHDLADEHPGRVEIAPLDINEPAQIAALYARLCGRSFDILFANAGTANPLDETIAVVSTDEFVRVMVTNALSPMRVIEGLQDLVPADGLIGVMSSGQGSVSNNEKGASFRGERQGHGHSSTSAFDPVADLSTPLNMAAWNTLRLWPFSPVQLRRAHLPVRSPMKSRRATPRSRQTVSATSS